MADQPPQYVSSIKVNGAGRVEAEVILGATRFGVVVPADDQVISGPLKSLSDALVKRARETLAEQLEMELSPSVRASLTT